MMTIITAASFNISASHNPEAVRDLMREHRIDIFGLQEVDRNAERSSRIDVAKFVAGNAFQAFSPSMRFGHLKRSAPNGDISYKSPATGTPSDAVYGVALISSYPFAAQQQAFLGPDPKDYWTKTDRYAQREAEPRSAIIGRLQIEGKDVWSLSTHLAYTKDRDQPSEVRASQVDKLMQKFVDLCIPGDAPFIGMADFNATPENANIRPIKEHFKMTSALTYRPGPNEKPDRQIDYLFFRNMELEEFRTIVCPGFDHTLSIAKLRF